MKYGGCCSQVRNALNCAFREKTYSLKCKNPFAKQILHGFLPVTGTEMKAGALQLTKKANECSFQLFDAVQ